jgi:hypothetical protein
MGQLADMAAMRRTHFGHLSGERREGEVVPDYLVGVGADAGPVSRIEARLLRANAATWSDDLAAVSLSKAAGIAVGGRMDHGLVEQLCLLAIRRGHSHQVDLATALESVLPPEGTRRPSFLERVPDDAMPPVALSLLNAAKRNDEPLRARVTRTIRQKRIADELAKDLVAQNLELFELEPYARTADNATVLQWLSVWPPRRARARQEYAKQPEPRSRTYLIETDNGYAHLLTVLWHGGEGVRPDVVARAEEAMSGDLEPTEAQVRLALNLAHHLVSRGEGESTRMAAAVRVLRDGIERNFRVFDADVNEAVYRVLYFQDPQRSSDHAAKCNFWRSVKIERAADHIAASLEDRRFFEVFYYYFKELLGEVPIDTPVDEVLRRLKLPAPERGAAIADWRSRGASVPAPIVSRLGGSLALSAEYVILGHYLFHTDLGEVSGTLNVGGQRVSVRVTDKDHEAFNERARGYVSQLYQLLIDGADVPGAIRRVLQRHAERFAHQW